AQLAAFDRFEVRAEHVDELVGLHELLLLLASSDSAFRPRCTETLMADCDMPDCAAASRTVNPSSLTNWMACRALGLRWAMSLCRSSPLSTAAGSSSASMSPTSLMETSFADALVRRRKSTSR